MTVVYIVGSFCASLGVQPHFLEGVVSKRLISNSNKDLLHSIVLLASLWKQYSSRLDGSDSLYMSMHQIDPVMQGEVTSSLIT